MQFHKPQAADSAKLNPAPRRNQPVRLPQATADLVERMLTVRCGAARQEAHRPG
jgi:hypothetical protein